LDPTDAAIVGVGKPIPSGGSNMFRIGAILVVTTLALAGNASSQEKQIQQSELPPAVEKTVVSQSQGATIRGFSKETEKGKTYYEVAMTVNGLGKDVSMDANGNVVETEIEVPFDSLPAAVKAGLTTQAGKGTIGKVESLTKSGKLVAYEAHVITGTKKSEIQVGPDGKPLAHEE
jgi:hypothetical protein